MKLRAVPRTSEEPDSKAIEIRRVALENELFQVRMNAPFPTGQAIARYNERIEELERQLKALPPKPLSRQIFGMEAGTYVVADTRLGDSVAQPEPEQTLNHEYDPHRREYGY